MRKQPILLRIYIGGVALAAVSAFAWSLWLWRPVWTIEGMALPLVFGALIAIAYQYPLDLPPKQKVYVDTAALFAALLLFDVPTAMLVAVTACILSQLTSKVPWHDTLFNAGQVGLQVALAGLVYHGLSPAPAPFAIEGLQQATAVVAAAMTMYLTNNLAVAVAVGLQQGTNPLAVWWANWRYIVAEQAALFILGVLTALTVSVYPWSIVLTILPVVFVYMSLKNSLQVRLRVKETEAMARELSALTEVGEALNRALSLEEILDIVLREAMALVRRKEGSIILLDRRTNTMRIVANYGLPPEVVEAFNARPVYAHEGTFGIVIKTGEMLEIPDARSDPRVLHGAGRIPRQLTNVPLRTKEGVIGVIVLDALPPDNRARRLLMALADLAAIAIQRAQLFEAERRRATQLALINKVGEKTASILDLDRLMQEATRSIQESFNYYNVALLLLDERRREVVMQAVAGGFEHIAPGEYRQSLDEGIIGFVARSGNSWLANDVSKDPHYVKGFLEGVLTKSELCVPIKLGDKVLGALDVQSIRLNDFDEADVTAMETLADQIAVAIQNARLYEETRTRAERLAVVNCIARAASTTLHLDDLMETVYQEIAPVFQADAFFIALYDEEARELDFRLRVDEGIRAPRERRPVGTGLTSLVVSEKRPLLIRDFERERDRLPTPGVWGTMKIPASWLGVPMMIGDRLVGVICVQAYRPHAYGEEEQLLLSTIADQVAVAVENARLYEAEQKQRQLAQSLTEATAALSATLDFDQVLDRILGQVSRIIPNDATNIMFIEGDEARVARWRGYERFGTEKFVSTHVFRIPELANLQQMLESREPMVIPDTAAYPGWVQLPETEWLRSYAAAPIIVRGEVIGFLNVDSATPGFFTQAHAEALRAFADQAAIAIENARLFEEKERRVAQLAAISEVGRDIASLLNLNELLHRVVNLLVNIFGHYYANVLMVDEEAQEIVLTASAGQMGRAFEGRRLKIGEQGITGWVAESGEPLLVNDVDKEPRYYFVEEMADTKSELAVPIKLRGEVIGVLDVQSVEPGAFDELDLSTLTTLADQLAVAIENARLYQETERLAITDGLTGLYNRRHFYEMLDKEIESVKRYDGHLSLIMLDIDDFKAYNDTYGHLTGDALLRELAELLARDTRKVDIGARYGGDEFVILLPHTDKEQAVVLAGRIRTSVEGYEFWGREGLPTGEITVSVGVATCPEDAAEPEALVHAADMALLEAKKRGNRVCVYGEMA